MIGLAGKAAGKLRSFLGRVKESVGRFFGMPSGFSYHTPQTPTRDRLKDPFLALGAMLTGVFVILINFGPLENIFRHLTAWLSRSGGGGWGSPHRQRPSQAGNGGQANSGAQANNGAQANQANQANSGAKANNGTKAGAPPTWFPFVKSGSGGKSQRFTRLLTAIDSGMSIVNSFRIPDKDKSPQVERTQNA